MLLAAAICAVTVGTSTDARSMPKYRAGQKLSQAKIAGETCAVCKKVVAYIEYYKLSTQVDIEAELERMCNLLPGGLTARCQSSVKQYTALLIQPITSGVAPQEVCAKLSLCEAPPSHNCPTLDVCFEMGGPDCEVEFFTDSLGCDRCRCIDPLPTPPSHNCPPLDRCFEMEMADHYCEVELFTDSLGCDRCRCKDPLPMPDFCLLPNNGPWCGPWGRVETSIVYYYNTKTGACQEFPNYTVGSTLYVLGPCEDTKNKFKTLQECQMICHGTPVVDDAVDVGPLVS